MDTEQTKPTKIAILGGGMGGLVTAWELSSQEDWERKFDITIYQMGHRLGGKCASSRGPNGRIEEHGIHGFLGSYYNTLPMMVDLYAELGRQAGEPLATFQEAFVGSGFSMMWEMVSGTLTPWPIRLPPNPRLPSDRGFYKGLATSIDSIFSIARALLSSSQIIPPAMLELVTASLDAAQATLTIPTTEGPNHPLVPILESLRAPIVGQLDNAALPPDLRRIFILVDYLTVMILGALLDNVSANGYGDIDHENWSDWLARHGIHRLTLASPVPMETINICYQSPRGDTTRHSAMAAGAFLNWSLKSYSYLGHFLWSFGAGTGETIIAPLYIVLKRRGVKFKFFHKVENLKVSRENPKEIDAIDMVVQAHLIDEANEYAPLIHVPVADGTGRLPSWPRRANFDQLVEGDELRKDDIDLESWWNGWPRDGRPGKTLRKGRDFDKVVFAIGPAAARHVCAELIAARPEWKSMVANLPAVQTQSMQIWLKEDYATLGWPEAMTGTDTPCSATYIGTQNGNEEFSGLLRWEGWNPINKPKSIWYFCGLMPSYEPEPPFSDTGYPSRQSERVKFQNIQYLSSSIGWMLPRATCQSTQGVGDPVSLDFDLLVDWREDCGDPVLTARGAQRFDSQFWRANIDPSELYITTPPGSTAYRLKAWESGFSNLVLAGDWIYTGLNVGSFEGATISGKLASHALSAVPALENIVGYPIL